MTDEQIAQSMSDVVKHLPPPSQDPWLTIRARVVARHHHASVQRPGQGTASRDVRATGLGQWAWAVMAVGLIVTLTVGRLPTARAQVRAFLTDVGQRFSIGALWCMDVTQQPVTSASAPLPYVPVVTLTEARERVSYMFDVPATVPPGYTVEHVELVSPSIATSPIVVRWRDTDGTLLRLTIAYRTPPGVTDGVVPKSVQAVRINGAAGVLRQRTWQGATGPWDSGADVLTLVWQRGDLTYHLDGTQPLTSQDLVQVAESIR